MLVESTIQHDNPIAPDASLFVSINQEGGDDDWMVSVESSQGDTSSLAISVRFR